MDRYARKHLTDSALWSGFRTHVSNERGSLADVLADIAEIDERRLFVAAAHPSMVSCMVHEMRFTEQAALKRLRASRTAQKFPAVYPLVAAGRLHLTAIVALTGHLDAENADELLAAAEGKTTVELERWLRERMSKAELPLDGATQMEATEEQVSLRTVEATHTSPEAPTRTATPQSEARSELRCLVDREGQEALDYARVLLSHAIPSGDMGRIISRAGKALVRELEKEMFGSSDRPGKSRASSDPRHIPFAVKREVWKRDGGQCAFHSDDGKRCPSRELVQFHHIEEVAIGGTASVENISLRCRAHNQYESEKTFGKAFMDHKREQAKATAGAKRRSAEAAAYVVPPEAIAETIWWLRIFGYSETDARWALGEVGPQFFLLPGTRNFRCMEALRARDGDTSPLFSKRRAVPDDMDTGRSLHVAVPQRETATIRTATPAATP